MVLTLKRYNYYPNLTNYNTEKTEFNDIIENLVFNDNIDKSVFNGLPRGGPKHFGRCWQVNIV